MAGNTDKAKRRNYRNEYLYVSEQARQARDQQMFGKSTKLALELEKKADNLLKASQIEKKLRDANKHKWKGTM